MNKFLDNCICSLLDDCKEAEEATLLSNLLSLCSRFEAPIPASDLITLRQDPTIESGIPDAHGRLRSLKITCRVKLIHKSEEGFYVDNGTYEQFPGYPLDEVNLIRHYSQYDIMKQQGT